MGDVVRETDVGRRRKRDGGREGATQTTTMMGENRLVRLYATDKLTLTAVLFLKLSHAHPSMVLPSP